MPGSRRRLVITIAATAAIFAAGAVGALALTAPMRTSVDANIPPLSTGLPAAADTAASQYEVGGNSRRAGTAGSADASDASGLNAPSSGAADSAVGTEGGASPDRQTAGAATLSSAGDESGWHESRSHESSHETVKSHIREESSSSDD